LVPPMVAPPPPQMERLVSKGYSTPLLSPDRSDYSDDSPLLSLSRVHPGAFAEYGPNYAEAEAPPQTAFASMFSPPITEGEAGAVRFTTKGGILRCDGIGCVGVRGDKITAVHRHTRQHVTAWHALLVSDLRTDQQRNALNRESAFMLSSPPR
jgi:hypothetical protein